VNERPFVGGSDVGRRWEGGVVVVGERWAERHSG